MKTTTDHKATPVVLRVWKDKSGGVFALFPTLPSDEYGHYCDSYDSACGHSGADYWGCIKATRQATPEESADLLTELRRHGYRPCVVTKASSFMHKMRVEEAKRLRYEDS